jgi:hypothetical protein
VIGGLCGLAFDRISRESVSFDAGTGADLLLHPRAQRFPINDEPTRCRQKT